MRRRSGLFLVLFGGAALLLGAGVASCRQPTEVTIAITTDVPCAQLRGMTITVGHLGEIETKDPALNSIVCDANGNLGTLVVVPSGADDEQVAIRAIAGNGKDPEQCVAPAYGPQCIVARRALRFLPHAALTVPIALRVTCDGIPCGPTETCVKGLCKSAVIDDPENCRNGCDEDTLGPSSGAPADGGSTDGSSTDGNGVGPDGGPVVFGSGGACEDMGGYEVSSPWPVRGGCSTHRGRTEVVGPPAVPVVKWSLPVGFTSGQTSSSPVIGADGTIYVGGSVLWAIAPNGVAKWSAGSATSTTPVVATTGVLHVEGQNVVARQSSDGGLIWTGPAMQSSTCSPVLDRDGTIYGSGSGPFLGAIHANGTPAFGFDDAAPSAPVYASPAVGASTIYWTVIGGQGLHSTRPDGSSEWVTTYSPSPSYDMHVVGADGTIYTSTGNVLYATSPDGGLKWSTVSSPYYGGAPAIGQDDLTLISYTDPDGGANLPFFEAIDPDTGAVVWRFQLDGSGGVPVVDGEGTAYVGTSAGSIYAISPSGASVEPQEGGPVVPAGAKLFKTGVQKWKITVGGDARAPMAIGKDGTLYAAVGDGKLYAIGTP